MGENYKETRDEYGERNRFLKDYNDYVDEKQQKDLDFVEE
jgi:hypothetical protein